MEQQSFEVSPQLLRQAMGGFATGVAIVTTKADGELHGMTVNSLTSVSLDPPLLLVCFVKGTRTQQAVEARGAFVVNLLTKRQEAYSDRFAKPGIDHFGGVEVEYNELDLPVLPRGLGHLVCEMHQTYPGGDHDIVVGRVLHCQSHAGSPLVFYRGKYHSISQRGRDAQVDWYW